MAYNENVKCITLPAAADFSTTGMYRFGSVNASGQVALTAADARIDGVVYDKPDTIGHATAVAIEGIAMVELGGTVAAGAEVESDASGVAVTKAAGLAGGVALVAGVSGDIIPVLLKL